MGKPRWSVIRAVPREDYTIEVEFYDGKTGIYDAKPLLEYKVYAPLKRLPFFLTAHVEYGTIVWNDDLDVAPERVYDECRASAEA